MLLRYIKLVEYYDDTAAGNIINIIYMYEQPTIYKFIISRY